MPTYEFEVSNCVKIRVSADDVEKARMKLIENEELMSGNLASDCCISDGEEVK